MSAQDNHFLWNNAYEWQPELGLYLCGHRGYSPQLGRWLSPDPSGYGGGDVNWSRYCGNDPVNGLDPSGLAIIYGTLPTLGGPGNSGVSCTLALGMPSINPLSWNVSVVSNIGLSSSPGFSIAAGVIPFSSDSRNLSGPSGSLAVSQTGLLPVAPDVAIPVSGTLGAANIPLMPNSISDYKQTAVEASIGTPSTPGVVAGASYGNQEYYNTVASILLNAGVKIIVADLAIDKSISELLDALTASEKQTAQNQANQILGAQVGQNVLGPNQSLFPSDIPFGDAQQAESDQGFLEGAGMNLFSNSGAAVTAGSFGDDLEE